MIDELIQEFVDQINETNQEEYDLGVGARVHWSKGKRYAKLYFEPVRIAGEHIYAKIDRGTGDIYEVTQYWGIPSKTATANVHQSKEELDKVIDWYTLAGEKFLKRHKKLNDLLAKRRVEPIKNEKDVQDYLEYIEAKE